MRLDDIYRYNPNPYEPLRNEQDYKNAKQASKAAPSLPDTIIDNTQLQKSGIPPGYEKV